MGQKGGFLGTSKWHVSKKYGKDIWNFQKVVKKWKKGQKTVIKKQQKRAIFPRASRWNFRHFWTGLKNWVGFFSTFCQKILDFRKGVSMKFQTLLRGLKKWWKNKTFMAERSLEKVKKQQLFFWSFFRFMRVYKVVGSKMTCFFDVFFDMGQFHMSFPHKISGSGTWAPFYVERHIDTKCKNNPKMAKMTHFRPLFLTPYFIFESSQGLLRRDFEKWSKKG